MAISITRPEFILKVRQFLLDKAANNRLIRDIESDDDTINLAIDLAIDDWNVTPPLIGNTAFATFPSEGLLMQGTVIIILTSQGILQTRNRLPYNSGGITVDTFSKGPDYQNWMGMFLQAYSTQKKNYKISQNLERGWGGYRSNFDWLGGSGV